MYSLTYDMLVRVLQQFNYTGEVHADVHPRAEVKDGGLAILLVQTGAVVSCSIFNRSGQKLYHDTQAYQHIERMGVLDWKLVLVPSLSAQLAARSSSRELPAQMRDGSFPRHRVVSPTQMRGWSMLYRSVYSLCDGTHSNELIATLLSRSPHSVEKVIRDLIEANAIEK